jgi:hypothetical protein
MKGGFNQGLRPSSSESSVNAGVMQGEASSASQPVRFVRSRERRNQSEVQPALDPATTESLTFQIVDCPLNNVFEECPHEFVV